MIKKDDISRLMGADVYGTDGAKIGPARQVYLDDETGDPEWVCVRTGLFGTKETFIPLNTASFSGDRIEVPFEKERVKNAPRIDADGSLSPGEEDELYAYYGVEPISGVADDAYENGTMPRDSALDQPGTTMTEGTATDGDVRDRDAVGHDTSGPTTDNAMTRSEERLVTGTRQEQVGKVRLRKYVVTEEQQVTVPVSREEVRLERVPITDDNVDRAMDGPALSEEEHEVVLHAERPVVATEAVPVERVRLGKETVTEQETVTGEVRKEAIEFDGPDTTTQDRPRA
ncbi:MAG TPA: PRC and DUF2382 domain-containing protein [Catenuloplanes sp.]|jgi:uncharacterized protein (TIGR02271 family)